MSVELALSARQAKIIDGKAIAKKIKDDLKSECKVLLEEYGVVPGLSVILVGKLSL